MHTNPVVMVIQTYALECSMSLYILRIRTRMTLLIRIRMIMLVKSNFENNSCEYAFDQRLS